jgi:hypothetical protein
LGLTQKVHDFSLAKVFAMQSNVRVERPTEAVRSRTRC